MSSVSITQLKTNPSKVIRESLDFPVAVENRNKIEAYLVGKELYDIIASHIEDLIDKKALDETPLHEGEDFEEVVKEMGL